MQQKLTLRLDDRLIRRAKVHARKSGKSVSQMVADYFGLLGQSHETGDINESPTIPPDVRSLRGRLKGAEVKDNEYQEYLEKKYR